MDDLKYYWWSICQKSRKLSRRSICSKNE